MMGLITELYMLCLGASIMAKTMQIVVAILFIFSIIGIVSTINFFAKRRKPKEDPHQKWLRTGKM